MKFPVKSKTGIIHREHEAMCDEATAAIQMDSFFKPRTGVYINRGAGASRTASSEGLLDDVAIKTIVKDAINSITSVDGALEITVKSGWVTLRGNLDNWAKRKTIERIARSSIGVRGVTNSIRIGE